MAIHWHESLQALASHPKAGQWIIALAVLLVLPALAGGFFADDFGHFLLVNEPGLVPQSKQGSIFHLFEFVDQNPARRQMQYSQSLIPWWTSGKLSVNFWRPASELTHWLDYLFFPEKPWLMHLHSIAWYFLLLLAVFAFYKNTLSVGHLPVFALLFFALDSTHGMTVSWLANRNALISTAFALPAFILYSHSRIPGRERWVIPSCIALAASLLSAEIGISIVGFLLAYALFLDRDGPLRGLLRLWPLLTVVVIWQVAYHFSGYGISGSAGFYIDPAGSPLQYTSSLLLRFPLAISAQFNLLPIHLVSFLQAPATIAGFLIFVGLVVVALKKRDAGYNFYLLSLGLAVFPVAITIVQDRNLLFVGIAGAGILAKIVAWLSEARQASRVAGFCLVILLVFHLPVSALLMLPATLAPSMLAKNSIDSALSLGESVSQKRIISLGMPLYEASYLAAIRKVHGLPLPDRFWNITTFTDGVSVQRLSSDRVVVRGKHGLLRGDDLLLRNLVDEPFSAGQEIDLDGLRLKIVEVNGQGVPMAVELYAGTQLPGKDVQFYYWQDQSLFHYSLAENEIRYFKPKSTGWR